MVDEALQVVDLALYSHVVFVAYSVAEPYAHSIVANHQVVLRQRAEEFAKMVMFPILFDTTDPPCRKHDRRALAIRGASKAFSFSSLAKTDVGHAVTVAVARVLYNARRPRG